jgi:biotin carboxyl carrier protein
VSAPAGGGRRRASTDYNAYERKAREARTTVNLYGGLCALRVPVPRLMRYEVEIGGRRRQVVVIRAGDGFAVSVDGRTRHVDSARIDAHTVSLLVGAGEGLKPVPYEMVLSNEVSIAADRVSGQLTVHAGSTPIAVTLNGRRRWGRKDEAAGPGSGPQRLVAPMPGKVVRVLVKAGDLVTARQSVVVVEAMKMENELRATREGTVAEIHVREGMSVDAGALLLVIQ